MWSEVWNQEFGVWRLKSGFMSVDSGNRDLVGSPEPGFWNLEFEVQIPESEIWSLESGI